MYSYVLVWLYQGFLEKPGDLFTLLPCIVSISLALADVTLEDSRYGYVIQLAF